MTDLLAELVVTTHEDNALRIEGLEREKQQDHLYMSMYMSMYMHMYMYMYMYMYMHMYMYMYMCMHMCMMESGEHLELMGTSVDKIPVEDVRDGLDVSARPA